MQQVRWMAVLGLAALLAFGGAALAEENGGTETTADSVYATDGTTNADGATTGADGATPEVTTDNGTEPDEVENTLAAPAVTDAVYGEPCERTVGGVTLQVPACDRVTRHAILSVRLPDLAAGTVVNIGVHRPGRREGRGYVVRGDGTTKHVALALLPGVNVITVSVNNEVQNFRVIRVGPGQKLRAFMDVAKKRHWAREHVDKLAANGVFDGYLEGENFDPDRPATRGDVAAFLDKVVNVDADVDLPAEAAPADARRHKAAKAIQRVMKQGLMKGVGQGRFAPEKQLTRAEVATMLDRALPPVQVNVNLDVAFKDGKQVPDWARQSMARMRARGLISGYEDKAGDKTIRPDRVITRGELAALLSRFMDYRNARHDASQ